MSCLLFYSMDGWKQMPHPWRFQLMYYLWGMSIKKRIGFAFELFKKFKSFSTHLHFGGVVTLFACDTIGPMFDCFNWQIIFTHILIASILMSHLIVLCNTAFNWTYCAPYHSSVLQNNNNKQLWSHLSVYFSTGKQSRKWWHSTNWNCASRWRWLLCNSKQT